MNDDEVIEQDAFEPLDIRFGKINWRRIEICETRDR